MTIHVFFFFPETAGKTLEDTALMFEDPHGIRYLGTPAWKTRANFSGAQARERGDVLPSEKLGSDDEESPERIENVTAEKMA